MILRKPRRVKLPDGRTPKRVTLPDGRTFWANINLIRPYKQRAARKGREKRRKRINQRGAAPKGRRRRIKRIIGRGVARPYVDKRKRLMLGSGSSKTIGKQKGGLFPLGAAIAAAPPIIDLLTKIIK